MKKVWLLVLAIAMICPAIAGAETVNSKYNVDFYGYIKLDAVYQSGYALMDNFLLEAPPSNLVGYPGYAPGQARQGDEMRNRDQDSFSMTARQSRFGFLIDVPGDGGLSSRGRIEADFYGATGGAAGNSDPDENKGNLMLRRAYVEIYSDTWSVLAGNEWMVVSPIFPHVNNYPYGADIGNLGYRTPQIRLTGYALDKQLMVQVAAVNKMGNPDALDIDTGRLAGAPTWEYGITFSGPVTIGYTGHYGQEEIQSARGGAYGYFGTRVDSFSHNVHFKLPLGDMIAISGEYFQGANLDGWYTGGQRSGWVMNEEGDREPLNSQGGWGEVMIKPMDNLKFHFGYGIDDVEDDQLRDGILEGEVGGIGNYVESNGNLAITKNEMYYGNLFYNVNKATMISFEYMQVISQYDNARHNDPVDGGKLHFEPGVAHRYTLSYWLIF